MLTALLFMLAAPPVPDPEAERLRIAVAVAIEIAKAKEKKPAPKVDPTPAKTLTDRERYAYLVKAVEDGVRPVAMIVGPHASLHEYIHQERFPSGWMGLADGVYDCFRRDSDGTAVMLKREEVKPAATPFPRPATTPFSGRAIPVQSAEKFLTSRPGAVQYAVPTYTLTGFTGGITWTSSCPPSG